MGTQSRVLVVDDDMVCGNLLKEVLGAYFDTRFVSSGTEALNEVKSFQPDLVLLDIMMPDVDGYQICRSIRSNQNTRFTKIIFVTAKTMLPERLKGYDVGADDYLTKPFDENELLAKVKIFSKLRSSDEVDVIKRNLLMLFSHETRTSLNGILGFSEMLKSSPNLTPREREYADMISNCGKHLFNFSNKALMLCELNSTSQLNFDTIDSGQLAGNVISNFEGSALKDNVTLVLVEKDRMSIRVDAMLLQEALGYVVENAIKFSPAGESVCVQVSREGGFCSFSVSDSGPGVNEKTSDRLFEGFVVDDISHHKSGQGLSLAIARAVLERHGGSICVANNPAGGANFVLSVPCQPVPSDSHNPFA